MSEKPDTSWYEKGFIERFDVLMNFYESLRYTWKFILEKTPHKAGEMLVDAMYWANKLGPDDFSMISEDLDQTQREYYELKK